MPDASMKEQIIVAVDFGTTYSGVAWASTNNPDNHTVINIWPRNKSGTINGMTSDKVPSEIAYEYDDSGPKSLWGFQIPSDMPRVKWVKLQLAPELKLKFETLLSSTYKDRRDNPIPYHSTHEQAVTDYLCHLYEQIIKVLKTQKSPSITSNDLKFVLTVPAMWSEKAKVATIKCAHAAGFGEASDIRIISEPEAAAVHALCASNPHGLEVDDTVVLLDAGGGTCDLITFSIVELKPTLRLKEAAPGDGSLCGSTFLNRKFEEFLENRLSSAPEWGLDTLNGAMDRFETAVKRGFDGNPEELFNITVPGIPDNEIFGVKRGRLQMTGSEMSQLFLPVLGEIINLAKKQVQISKKEVKAIILVGGFGQSPYLQKLLRDSLPEIEILVPSDGWTAVVRGALRKTLGEMSSSAPQIRIESRKARKHYGLLIRTDFDRAVHDRNKKYWHEFEGNYVIDVMEWFIKKGESIKEAKPVITKWCKHQRVSEGPFDSIHVTLYELDTDTSSLYFNRQTKRHAVLNPQLDKIQKDRLETCIGADGEEYYEISFEIHAVYYSAHCEYTLWYEGKDHGRVKVDYV
ncbi:actin-like ATPase domain-containing protein [Aspergillus steynii IBT 23096]|uniref:Actin-like ATPase domain-containing protein n=1 Tax=Aspergillus steynii IBT 23096 TaxID=1392250 RepID=A0A2I2G5E2_9EURO|nr:actin-like ATPase domain-containing protein [Aspergillus steynii IBT 23096]PLB48097.1 actin-like ATPase domain-containing protein [Aspergillus steynii IBT 23096]